MPSNHLMLCHPVLLLPSIFPSNWVFSNELALHIRWPEYWSFSINPFNEYSGLISFRVDWFYFLAVPWTLKSLLQHHNSKASILWDSAFFMVQLSHPWASMVAQLVKNLPAMRRPGFYPWVGKIPWRRERLPTPIFWPGELHGLYNPWGHKESDTAEQLSLCHIHT